MESSKIFLKYMVPFQIPDKHCTQSLREEAKKTQALNGSLTLVDRAGKRMILSRHWKEPESGFITLSLQRLARMGIYSVSWTTKNLACNRSPCLLHFHNSTLPL